jgi:polysaccharide export outer membrane protein
MRKYCILFIVLISFGCRSINPSVMFKTPKGYDYQIDQTLANAEYKITPNDYLEFNVYSRDGFNLIDQTAVSIQSAGTLGNNGVESLHKYLVELDGYVKLPILGRIKIKDMTIKEAEKMLETQYATYYQKPFVQLKVINRRVLIFPGSGGSGRVVLLENENTTLVEALAIAGGIAPTGKAWRVKLIRGDLRNPQIQLIDLSTIEGVKQSNLLLQANDIIYVEPVPNIAANVLAQISPIIGIITSALVIYNIAVTLKL